ncbi:GNAT family N-acetyltransferase [Pseudomonas sp. FP2196]|uniref:GNAT family N-acetyltransferase n=1 Tax=Pseudomonas sp. FP2196 TaxID=2954086 RepID=UPI002736A055|nr:GNAT family N-acetyltransferase [Pseudomonas sp. FP2196]WLH38156.1 GNAT family N-acetyltransferase [Pseudomonas sp. FP2196]
MEQLILRNYRETDATAVSQLFRQVYGDHYVQPHVYLPHLISQNHADKRWHSLVAVVGQQIRGHATLFRDTNSQTAELALSAVHPDTRGQNIATRLGQQLLAHAQALGCHDVSIKQVTHHPYTQRMATNLGFHNTGLLPDYVPSPFGCPAPESIVLGCRVIDGYQRPLPRQTWPASCRAFMQHLCRVFGTQAQMTQWRGPAIQLEQHANRHDMRIKELAPGLIKQIQQLPQHWLISIRLGLSQHFARDLDRLAAIGFVFTGLAPVDGRDGNWIALFHRGVRQRALELHCPRMQHLHDEVQRKIEVCST